MTNICYHHWSNIIVIPMQVTGFVCATPIFTVNEFFWSSGKVAKFEADSKIIWLPSPKQIKCQQTSKYPLQKIRFFGLETTIKKGGGGIFQSILVPINGSVLSQDCLKKYFGVERTARFEKIDPKLSTCIFGKNFFYKYKKCYFP